MVGHKRDSVYERYNVASKRDLDVAREKMDRNAMERLYSTSNSHPNSHHFARDGQSLGKVEPILGSSDAQNSAKLLEVNDGPVAQDRKSTRLNSSHLVISYAVFCLKKKKKNKCD